MRRHESIADRFCARLKDHRAEPEAAVPDLMLAVGFLMGAEMPSCAAAIAAMIERDYPGRYRFLWQEAGDVNGVEP